MVQEIKLLDDVFDSSCLAREINPGGSYLFDIVVHTSSVSIAKAEDK